MQRTIGRTANTSYLDKEDARPWGPGAFVREDTGVYSFVPGHLLSSVQRIVTCSSSTIPSRMSSTSPTAVPLSVAFPLLDGRLLYTTEP